MRISKSGLEPGQGEKGKTAQTHHRSAGLGRWAPDAGPWEWKRGSETGRKRQPAVMGHRRE